MNGKLIKEKNSPNHREKSFLPNDWTQVGQEEVSGTPEGFCSNSTQCRQLKMVFILKRDMREQRESEMISMFSKDTKMDIAGQI